MKHRKSLAVLKLDQSVLFFQNSYGLGDHGWETGPWYYRLRKYDT